MPPGSSLSSHFHRVRCRVSSAWEANLRRADLAAKLKAAGITAKLGSAVLVEDSMGAAEGSQERSSFCGDKTREILRGQGTTFCFVQLVGMLEVLVMLT